MITHFKKFGLFSGLILAAGLFASFNHQPTQAVTPPATLDPQPLRELHTAPSQRYLYTGDWDEVVSARQNNGVVLSSNRPLGYLFKGSSVDTQPLYRLRQKSTGNWLVTPSESERDALVNVHKTFVFEKTIGHVYTAPQYGAERINRYSNGKGWRLAYHTQDAAMKAAGYKLDGFVGFILKNYYHVGAYYFGMFNQEGSSDIRAGTRAVYGRDDWWGGVKDFYGQEPGVPQDTRGWSGDFSHLKPQIGYYDNSQPAVLEQHINQAADRGLSHFNFYYYWSNQEKRPTIDGGLQAFLQASNRNKMKFTISPCFHQYGADAKLGLQPADFQTAANYISDVTMQPNFLKTQSGRPFMFMCDTRGIDNGNIASANQFVALLKQTIKQKTGKEPFILQHSEYGAPYVQQLHGDGLTCLNHNKPIEFGSYQMYLDELKAYFNYFDTQRPMVRCAISGFDEKPRTDIAMPASSVRYFRDFSFTKYIHALWLTRESMNGAPASEIDNYLTVYAWNEWHEGGVIEPNVRDGNLYLRQLQQSFNLPPNQ